jgi:predicted peptidase
MAHLCAIVVALSAGCPTEPHVVDGKFAKNMYRYQIDVYGDRPWYLYYRPESYDPETPIPLILYWHGLFQCGRDGYAPYTELFSLAFQDHPELYPCIIAMPQLPYGTSTEKAEAIFNAVLWKMKQDFNIDRNRIYVCGSSVGSQRAFEYVAHTPDIFAALFAISGPVDVSYAPMLTDIPIFMAHGDADLMMPVEDSRALVEAIRAEGGTVDYVEYPCERHEIFYGVYANPDYLEWLFAQQLHP